MKRYGWLLIFVVAAACDSSRIYETNQEFKANRWLAQDTARFVFTIADSSASVNLYVNLRNSIDFATSRVFLQYQLADSSGNELRARLLNFMLFDKKTGEPFGKSGLGDLYDHQFMVEPNVLLPPGAYSIALTQMMRTEVLEEVVSVGIRVEKSTFK